VTKGAGVPGILGDMPLHASPAPRSSREVVPDRPADLIRGRAGTDPALDLGLSTALLEVVARGERRPVLRFYRPLPTVAFSRRDTFLPGFARAAAVARERGFDPVIRAAGGRAAAYDEGCLIVDEIMPAPDSVAEIRERFAAGADLQARALRTLGVDARVGEVAGEYCPGEFSVNARGETKLIGSAQRIVRGGWLFAAVIVVTPGEALRPVLEDVYAALSLSWEPDTTGSVAAEAPDTTVDDVERSLLDRYEQRYRLQPATLARGELDAARAASIRHRVGAP
jgi:octanoyl-[GcvH]:protein N-octanoyltransferase